MREILFRGRNPTGDFVYGFYLNVDVIHKIFVVFTEEEKQMHKGTAIEDADGYWEDVFPETVGQYTGLTDKNGKRIFEGDIVTGLFLFGLSVNAVVTFKDGAFGLEWYRGDTKTFNAFTSICNVEYEVIGNIRDNPELLK